MFLRNQFKGDGVFELPVIRRESVALEEIARPAMTSFADNSYEKKIFELLLQNGGMLQ